MLPATKVKEEEAAEEDEQKKLKKKRGKEYFDCHGSLSTTLSRTLGCPRGNVQ
jgi:hypothetical protein